MAKAPVESVRTGSIRYKLIAKPGLLEYSNHYGSTNSKTGIIKYDPEAKPAHTVIHECIHGVRKHLVIDPDDDRESEEDERKDEYATRVAENNIVAFIADNVALCRWIIDEIDREVNGNSTRNTCSCQRAACGKPAGTCCTSELPVNT